MRLCALEKIFQHYVCLGQSSPHAVDLKWSPFKSHQSLERGHEKGQASWAEVDCILHPLLSAWLRGRTPLPGSCPRGAASGTVLRWWWWWWGCPKRTEKFARERLGKVHGRKAPRGSLLCTAVLPVSMREVVQEGWIWILLCLPFGGLHLSMLDINLCLIDQKAIDPWWVNMILISLLQVTHWFSAHCHLELWSSLFFDENIKERGAEGVLVTAINFTVHWKPH